jgi:cytochrome c-type biogenesis protein CcmH
MKPISTKRPISTRRFLATICCIALAFAGFGLSCAHAVQPDEIMADPAREARARDLSRELRCMVCQNQSIDDSEAPLARDLRLLVRERIAAGDSNSQVVDFLVARYGEFVLLKPRFEPQTWLLWLVPPLVLAGGGLALWLYSRRRPKAGEQAGNPELSADEEARLRQLMAQDAPSQTPL